MVTIPEFTEKDVIEFTGGFGRFLGMTGQAR